MPTYKTITLYQYDELPSDSAKEKARNWYREGGLDYEWYDYLFEEFTEDMSKEGIDILTHKQTVTLAYASGAPSKTFEKHNIYFSGFSSQGDGASFEANVNVANWIKAHKLANKYRKLYNLCRQEGYRIAIRKSSNNYSHHMTMMVDSDASDYPYPDDAQDQWGEVVKAVLEDCRNHAKTLYRQLEEEYYYLNSNESVADTIRINEYTFTEDGNRE